MGDNDKLLHHVAVRLELYTFCYKENALGNSLVGQWFGLGAFTARTWVQSLVGELISHKMHSSGIKKKKKKKRVA